jgi:hypothetical protein
VSAAAIVADYEARQACKAFLQQVLPTRGNYSPSELTTEKKFKSYYATSIQNVVTKCFEIDENGNDAFFALASYREPGTRKGENVLWVKSFWIDIDCGEEKAAEGKGYKDKRAAVQALKAFCLASGLPTPTIIDSGGGLHCYWILEQEISAAEWLPLAKKLKKIMSMGSAVLLADPSRTADIASVLRPPGTHNHKPKYDNLPVKVLLERGDVDFADFSDKIDVAYTSLPPAPQQSGDLSNGLEKLLPPPETEREIERVKSKLAVLSADMDRATWLRVLFGLKSTGWACAEGLAREWSKKSDKYDDADFGVAWNSYRTDGGIGFGTLVHLAKEAGWKAPCASSKDEAIAKVNERYAVIESEAAIYDLQQDRFVSRPSFQLLHANVNGNIGTAEKPVYVDIGTHWTRHKDRRQHTELTLAPVLPQVTQDNQLNVWKGFTVPSVQGDTTLFLELAGQLIPNAVDRKYVVTWLARLIQNPAEKFHVALVVWSGIEGTGKNLFFESVGRIFHDRHFRVIGQEVFTDQFTEWQSHKVFIIADEVSAAGNRQTADRIKVLLTATKNSINVKNAPKYEEPNLVSCSFSLRYSS